MKLVLILLCLPIFIYSQTNISGIINNNQVWTISGSPYIITNNVLITTGAELQINPGVIIKFNSGNSLQVQGVLKAHGSSTNKIIFTSNDSLPSSGDWGVIEFMDQTIDASYDTLGQYIDGSCIINTNIRYGGGFSAQGAVKITNSAVYLDNVLVTNSDSKGIFINKSTGGTVPNIKIKNSEIINNNDAGIYCDCYQYNVSIEIDSSFISDNVGDGISTGSGDAGGSHNFIFTNNTITNNNTGITAHANGSQNIFNNIINGNYANGIRLRGNGVYNVQNNIITNNLSVGIHGIYATHFINQNIIAGNGGGIEISQGGDYTITNNLIYDNNNGGDGSAIDTYGGTSQSAWSPPININGNTITNNISVSAAILAFDPDNGTPPFLLNHNNIHNNDSPFAIKNYRDINVNNIDATYNFWGDTLASYIDTKIYDWFDNNTRSIVYYNPYIFNINVQNPISPPTNVVKYILGDVEVSWDSNIESDVIGYKIHFGNYNGYSFANTIDVGNITTYNLAGLVTQLDSVVAVTAYDSLADGINDQIEGHESWYSLAFVIGCTDSAACNYDASANNDDGSCLTDYGCMDTLALNYDSVATCDDGSCITVTLGCTDSAACNYDALATIDDASCIYLNILVSTFDVSCNGFADGSVVATANGGATPNLQYSLGGGLSQSNGTFSNLTAGTYFIDVTDINGCSSNQIFTITEPNPLFVNAFSTDINCFGYCDGSAFSMPSGGTPPYSYLWSNGNITDITSGLCAGAYVVNITDANNCVNIETVLISEPLPIVSNNTINGCDSVLIGSNYYTISGAYTDTLTSVNGCDSVVNTNLTIEQNTSSYDTLSVGASIVWNGMPLNVSGDYSVSLINSVGCDSIVNLNLTVTATGISDLVNSKSNLVKITDVLGQETPYRRNTPLFYIYDDGTVEKRIVLE